MTKAYNIILEFIAVFFIKHKFFFGFKAFLFLSNSIYCTLDKVDLKYIEYSSKLFICSEKIILKIEDIEKIFFYLIFFIS